MPESSVEGKSVKGKIRASAMGFSLNPGWLPAWLETVPRLSIGVPDCWFAFPTSRWFEPRKQGVSGKAENNYDFSCAGDRAC